MLGMESHESAPTCPKCSGPGTPLIFGRMGAALREAKAAGQIVVPGCYVPTDRPNWTCFQKHWWRDADEERHRSAVKAALRGRPHCPRCAGPSQLLVYPGAEDIWPDLIAEGEAVVADNEGPPGVNWHSRCRTCGHVWPG